MNAGYHEESGMYRKKKTENVTHSGETAGSLSRTTEELQKPVSGCVTRYARFGQMHSTADK